MATSKLSLSPQRQRLVEAMQSINFGQIGGLKVVDGEPVMNPPPRVVREIKFGGENGPRPELGLADFSLKRQTTELFEFFDQFRSGVIDVLEVKHGLPFRVIVAEMATGR
jgi:hypothetical protein